VLGGIYSLPRNGWSFLRPDSEPRALDFPVNARVMTPSKLRIISALIASLMAFAVVSALELDARPGFLSLA
jgi:hypothetical protein